MTAGLSAQQIERYERDGIVFPVRVLAEGEAARFRAALEQVAEQRRAAGASRRFDGLHLFFDWAYRLAAHGRVLDAVEGLLGGDILVDGTLVFYKPPQDAGYVSWHQDSAYSDWHLTPTVSAWIALTASHRANGCMRVVPGSHRQGQLAHSNSRDDANLLFRGEQVVVPDESRALDVVLRPGEMSLHHSTIVHGSNPNTSDEPRLGFIVRYVTTRVAGRHRPLLRVRGHAPCPHLRLAAPPAHTDPHAAFNAWRASEGF
jgi:ectoine hydroxylase-related dioxygenase (phytanoyl-CoA dioxygenase family)